MTYQVSITTNVKADDDKHAALEAYKAIMSTHERKTITLAVRNAAGIVKDVTLDIEEADDYAGFTPPTGCMG
ncbi:MULTISPECIES: hypothetical protein [unclassified Ensifer]|uniref:hypothetical protein n=1 Tax=unclassified Ensifer TaxID=2633371 RepID=UPI000812E1C4|nr:MULTISPECIES: hypothetical protein [unclassified Ensifer]OCP21937.1 hypothetical protein BC361_25550 [Ensifer sp. LC54]OCP23283.1 hypothetical protein BC363_25215 [Ensifer sp. LC384]